MVKTINELRNSLSPDVRSAAKKMAAEIIAEMNLAEARKACGLNQSAIANSLSIAQPNVSQIEQRQDAMISTLAAYIKALGGEMEINAKFPDGRKIKITQFN